MGMGSSQGRLLGITAQMLDLNFESQRIMNEKLSLATQRDDIYEEYNAALNATKIQVAFRSSANNGAYSYQNANFATLCQYSDTRVMDYLLKDSKTGAVYVTHDVAEAYDEYEDDKYGFAMAMVGDELNNNPTDDQQNGGGYNGPYSDEDYNEIFLANPDAQDKLNYYVDLWNAIHNADGYVEINSECVGGSNGEEWFRNMVNSGLVTLHINGGNTQDPNIDFQSTSVTTTLNENFLQEISDDKDVAKAEAEYEYKLGIIKDKDSEFDLELERIRTQTESLKLMAEGIKQVISDNIKRTYSSYS